MTYIYFDNNHSMYSLNGAKQHTIGLLVRRIQTPKTSEMQLLLFAV